MCTRQRQQRSSSPIIDGHNRTFIVKDFPDFPNLTNDLLLKTGDSTYSLLSPLYASDLDKSLSKYLKSQVALKNINTLERSNTSNSSSIKTPSNSKTLNKSNETSQYHQVKSHTSNAIKKSNKTSCNTNESKQLTEQKTTTMVNICSRRSSDGTEASKINKKTSLSSSTCSTLSSPESIATNGKDRNSHLTCHSGINGRLSWEDWLIRKTLKDIEKLKLKNEENNRIALEKKVVDEQKQIKSVQAMKNREEWLKIKTHQQRKLKKEKDAQLVYEKLKKEQEADLTEIKSKECYQKWYEKCLEKEDIRKKKLRQKKRQQALNAMNKKLQSEEAYQNWLKISKKKKPLNRYTYGYSGGSLFSFYDMAATPPPAYTNPLPWVNSVISIYKRSK